MRIGEGSLHFCGAFLLFESNLDKGETIVAVVILRDKEDQCPLTELVGKHTERLFGQSHTGIAHRRMQHLENYKLQRIAFAQSRHLLRVLELLWIGKRCFLLNKVFGEESCPEELYKFIAVVCFIEFHNFYLF